MKIYKPGAFQDMQNMGLISDTQLILDDADRKLGMYDFEHATYIQPCGNFEFCRALGLPEDKQNLANINIDFTKGKPSIWINTVTADTDIRYGLPGEVFYAEPTEKELYELIGQAILLLACDLQDTQESVSFYERLGAHIAGVSLLEYQQMIQAAVYQAQEERGVLQ